MNIQNIRATLDHHWEATVALDKYHDDVIVEFPQSGLVKESLVNRIYTDSGHTTHLNLNLRSYEYGRREGNLWITEKLVIYDGRPVNTVTIMEFRDSEVSRETHYFADPFVPPKWRSQWVEITK